MSLFRSLKEWFFPPYLEYREDVKSLTEYLPAGDLDALAAWRAHHIPYVGDFDANGRFDKLQDFNGADLTIKAKGGDCESIAAVYIEVIRHWKGWRAWHVTMWYDDGSGHDVCAFTTPAGKQGWIDGVVRWGGYAEMADFYTSIDWKIKRWYEANDLGEEVKGLVAPHE